MMRIVHYDDPDTTLRGQIYTDYFYGRPNYGETPELDELEHPILLALDEPISIPSREPQFEGDYDAVGCAEVRCVQLAGAVNVEHLRNIRGHGVALSGKLFHAHTGHHHAEVLIDIEPKRTALVDNRNTFPEWQVVRTGTGFLLGQGGLIVTAAHVVEGASQLTVTRGLFRSKVTLDRVDPKADLAVLRLAPSGVMVDVMARREKLVRPIRQWLSPQLGERVYAFGFPLRPVLPHSLNMTEGIVSAESGLRSDRFQISAPIQKGNSGGPVYDQHGNLIGIIASKLRRMSRAVHENVNFVTRTHPLLTLCPEIGRGDSREERAALPIRQWFSGS